MKARVVIQIEVETPSDISEHKVANAINAALEEPPCDWGNWTVGIARVVETACLVEDDDELERE